VTVLIAK